MLSLHGRQFNASLSRLWRIRSLATANFLSNMSITFSRHQPASTNVYIQSIAPTLFKRFASSTKSSRKISQVEYDFVNLGRHAVRDKYIEKFSLALTRPVESSSDLAKIFILILEDYNDFLFTSRLLDKKIPDFSKILSQLADKISDFEGKLEPKDIARGLYCLRDLKNKDDFVSTETELLVSAMQKKLLACKGVFTGHDITRSLVGIRNMTLSDPTKSILGYITDQIFNDKIKMSQDQIAICADSIRSMSEDVPEIRRLLASIAKRIIGSPPGGQFNTENLAKILISLHLRDNLHPEMKNLMNAIKDKLVVNYTPLNIETVSPSIFGLNNMKHDTQIVSEMVDILLSKTKKVPLPTSPVKAQLITDILKGTQNIKSNRLVYSKALKYVACFEIGPITPETAFQWFVLVKGIKEDAGNEERAVVNLLIGKVEQLKNQVWTPKVMYEFLRLLQSPEGVKMTKASYGRLASSFSEIMPKVVNSMGLNDLIKGFRKLVEMTPKDPYTLHYLKSLGIKLHNSRSTYQWGARQVSYAINSLESIGQISDNNPAICGILDDFYDIIVSKNISFTPISACYLLVGFSSMNSHNQHIRPILVELANQIANFSKHYDGFTITYSLRGLNLMQNSTNCPEVRRLVAVLYNQLKTIPSLSSLSSSQISNVLYGIRNMSSDQIEVEQLLLLVAQSIASSNQHDLPGHILCGLLSHLRNLNPSNLAVKAVLNAIRERLDATSRTTKLSAQDITDGLSCLINMPSLNPHDEVAQLLSTFSNILNSDPNMQLTNAQAVKALVGLTSLTSNREEALQLLLALYYKMESVDGLELTQACDMLHGMQGMSCKYEIVLKVLDLIYRKTAWNNINSNTPISPRNVSIALAGLQSINDDSEVAQGLLRILRKEIIRNSGTFTADILSYCLQGLRSMRCTSKEAKEVLASISQEISICQDKFCPVLLSRCYFSLRTIDNESEELFAILSSLYYKLEDCKEPFDSKEIGNTLYGLRKMNLKYNITRKTLVLVKEKLQNAIRCSDNEKIFMDQLTKHIVQTYIERLRASPSSSLQQVHSVMMEYLLLASIKESEHKQQKQIYQIQESSKSS